MGADYIPSLLLPNYFSMEIQCLSKSFVEFLSKDMTAEASKANANVGIVVGDKALFVPYHSILDFKQSKQTLTMCMLFECCRSDGDLLGFSNTLCIVDLLNPTMTKEEWLEEVKQQLTGEEHQKKAG